MLARITPARPALISEHSNVLRDHVHQCVVELVDPMKSTEALGWFLGDLRAPT
jgi:hypothetical protein